MADPVFDPTQTQFLSIRIPTGDELYNTLMVDIDPELTTDALPSLEEKYKHETPEESRARATRYEKAFAEYDRRLQNYMNDLQSKLRAHQRIAMGTAELGARGEEQDALAVIESSISKMESTGDCSHLDQLSNMQKQ